MSTPDRAPEVHPPWIQYPNSSPMWGGWRQGYSEAWLFDVWLPYWRRLDGAEREAFLAKFPPPDDFWRFYIEHEWV